MKMTITLKDGRQWHMRGLSHMRYNVQRSVLIIQHTPEPDKIACPEVKHVEAADILSISITAETE